MRIARRQDATGIVELLCRHLPLDRDTELAKWSPRLADGGETDQQIIFVCEQEGLLIAYGRASLNAPNSPHNIESLPEGWIMSGVFVDVDHRKKGLACKLIDARFEWLRSRTNEVWSMTGIDNEASFAMHAAAGFTVERHDVVLAVAFPNGGGAVFRRTLD